MRDFAWAIAESFARAEPMRFTATMSKRSRKGKVYVDYLRNAYNATAIARYSPRARSGAPVAAPMAWADIIANRERPLFTISEVPARLEREGDPWTGFFEVKQSITAAMKKAVGLR